MPYKTFLNDGGVEIASIATAELVQHLPLFLKAIHWCRYPAGIVSNVATSFGEPTAYVHDVYGCFRNCVSKTLSQVVYVSLLTL